MSSPPPPAAKTGIDHHHSASTASGSTSDAIIPNGHHHGTSSATSDAVTSNVYHHGAACGASIPNGYRHGTFSSSGAFGGAAASEDDLELTLGIPSFKNNVRPPPPVQQPRHQNHHLVPPPPPPPTLQPFFFGSLPTNGPLLNPNPNPSPFPSQVAMQPPGAAVHEAPSSSANPPRRQQPRQKQSRSAAPRGTAKEKSETIPPPYPWATDKRGGIHPLNTLIRHGHRHRAITGRVKCRKCERSYGMAFDLETKFIEVGSFLVSKKEELLHRAPDIWMNPVLLECVFCRQKNAVRPEIEGKKKNINWLFLFLGQMLGCCTGEQLKYFCKHNGHHHTAAKDRLLYLAYLGMCKQLDPKGPFDLKL